MKVLDFSSTLISSLENENKKIKVLLSEKKSLKYILLDSVIVGGIAACTTMTNNIPSLDELYILVKAFLVTFLLEIAIERGIKK